MRMLLYNFSGDAFCISLPVSAVWVYILYAIQYLRLCIMNVFEFENDYLCMHRLSVATVVMSVPKIFWFVLCSYTYDFWVIRDCVGMAPTRP